MASPPISGAVTDLVGGAGSGGTRICFNTHCKEPKSEDSSTRSKGWRLRSGELADLCDRCSNTYEQGTFCETFHLDDDGWKKCASCVKRVHCGCIVSATSFVLLDAGGIECISCAQKNFLVGSNQVWSSSNILSSERLKELPCKSWSQLSPSTAVPGQWRQAPSAWRSAVSSQSELHQRLSFEFDRPSNRSLVSEKRKVDDLHERPLPTVPNRITIDRHSNGSTGPKPSGFSTFHRDDVIVNTERLQESSLLVGDSDHMLTRKGVVQGSHLSSSAGIKIEKVPNACSIPHRPPLLKDGSKSPVVGLTTPLLPSLEPNDQIRVLTNHVHSKTPSGSMAKQLYPNLNSANDSISESQAQLRNGRTRVDSRTRTHLLPRYWPRITDQELQQISGDSNSVITPLFEKMLSASDAGRIGRLVLPKKCAEAYFPAIYQPEGLPLKVQDSTGKEWIFQFRFWPNNNSRMYVLEGVTPCIQSMQLQAGDIVTFSRIDPVGKLVMGFRKASNTQNEQALKSGNGFSSTSETSNGNNKQDRTTLSKNDKAEFIKKERPVSKGHLLPSKRKSSTVASKSKRLLIENEESIELKVTWEEAQELLRPAPNHVPSIVVIEGHEFEEYEEAPVLGKPTIFTTNQDGGKDQWAQCEDCLKWRKLPLDASLASRWTCLDNIWDPDRSSCLSAQEISKGQAADLVPFNSANSKKSQLNVESVEGSEGLDTLANLAIMSESESVPQSSQATTKHPRHRPGCSCIVCIQPPSGKGSKHKQSCGCNVCLTVKRRFHTLMLRKEKRLSEKEAETSRKKHLKQQNVSSETSSQQESDKGVVGEQNMDNNSTPNDAEGEEEEDSDTKKEMLSQMKTEIDLNMQPEKEEENNNNSNNNNNNNNNTKLIPTSSVGFASAQEKQK